MLLIPFNMIMILKKKKKLTSLGIFSSANSANGGRVNMPMTGGWIAEKHGRIGLLLRLSVGWQRGGILPELTGVATTFLES